MHQLLIAFVILFSASAYSQDFEINEEGKYEVKQIVSTHANSNDIVFDKLEKWFNYYFQKNENGKIHTIDKNEYFLMASPRMSIILRTSGQNSSAGIITYDIQTTAINNGSYEVILSNFYHESNRSMYGSGGELERSSAECGSEELPDNTWSEIKRKCYEHCQEILESLKSSMLDK